MTTDELIREIRKLVARCTASERATYEALTEEAESWQMRLDELIDDPEED